MSKELDEKWAELVAVGRAEWVEGMLRIAPDPATANPWDEGPRRERYEEDAPYIEGWSDGPWYPVWDDPATLGALVWQVCEAWGEEMLLCMDSKGDWGVVRAIPGYAPVIPEIHRTKAGALLAALEVTP